MPSFREVFAQFWMMSRQAAPQCFATSPLCSFLLNVPTALCSFPSNLQEFACHAFASTRFCESSGPRFSFGESCDLELVTPRHARNETKVTFSFSNFVCESYWALVLTLLMGLAGSFLFTFLPEYLIEVRSAGGLRSVTGVVGFAFFLGL